MLLIPSLKLHQINYHTPQNIYQPPKNPSSLYGIYQPCFEQSDWSIQTSHGTSSITPPIQKMYYIFTVEVLRTLLTLKKKCFTHTVMTVQTKI